MKFTALPFRACALVLGAATALGFTTNSASALDVCGLIQVNGQSMPGVLVALYDCSSGIFLGTTTTGPNETTDGMVHNYMVSVPSESVRLELFFKDDPTDVLLGDYCRGFVNCDQLVLANGKATADYNMSCNNPPPVGTPGYWKNHPAAWPEPVITVGGHTYTRERALMLMSTQENGDKTYNLFRHLVAAKLNVLHGSESSCIEGDLLTADNWMALHAPGSGVKARSTTWQRIAPVSQKIDDYNNGLLCAAHRE
jgi:hypothetical protein